MKCDRVSERVTDYLSGVLTEPEAAAVDAHLEGCADCRRELESLGAFWQKLGLLPDEEPGPELRLRFYAALEQEKRRHRRRAADPLAALGGWLAGWWSRPGVRRLALAASSLAVGLALGLGLAGGDGRDPQAGPAVAELRQEVDGLRQLVAVSLLQQRSASERLRGVSLGRDRVVRDDQVAEALIEAATGDPSVNVRLAAIDALGALGSRPAVRQRLEQSLPSQPSPLVQLAVIDLLLAADDRPADELVQRLLAGDSLDRDVRAYLTRF